MSSRNCRGLVLLPRRLPKVAPWPSLKRALWDPEWAQNAPRLSGAKRQAAIQATVCPLLTETQWEHIKLRYYLRCAYCRQIKPLTKDHVIPLSKGGQHTKANIIPACKRWNSRKGNRPACWYNPFYMP